VRSKIPTQKTKAIKVHSKIKISGACFTLKSRGDDDMFVFYASCFVIHPLFFWLMSFYKKISRFYVVLRKIIIFDALIVNRLVRINTFTAKASLCLIPPLNKYLVGQLSCVLQTSKSSVPSHSPACTCIADEGSALDWYSRLCWSVIERSVFLLAAVAPAMLTDQRDDTSSDVVSSGQQKISRVHCVERLAPGFITAGACFPLTLGDDLRSAMV